MMKAVFTGGGTGGHIYPALAVAQRFRDKHGCNIKYIGSENGMEKKIIEEAGFLFTGIETDGFRTKNPISNFKVLLKLRRAVKVVTEILKKDKPDFIFATGGYVSAPIILAGKKLKIPIFLHEQNSIPGLTNKISSRYARIVFTTFPGSERYIAKNVKSVYSGLPIRKDFYEINNKIAYEKFNFKEDKKTVLITGGSGGSLFLNQAVLSFYKYAKEQDIQVIHVTGKRDFTLISQQIEELGDVFENVRLYPYLEDMHNALAISNLCISRAGAAFLSEMTFLGKPGIIIPFPYAANHHQLENAKNLSKNGAIIMIEEKEIQEDATILVKNISEVLFDEKKLKKMQDASKEFGMKNTLEIIEKNIFKETGVKY